MKRILVHLDACARSETRLRWAQWLARRHEAEVTAMYAMTSSLLTTPVGGEGLFSGVSVLAERDEERRRDARALFERFQGEPPMAWIDAGIEMPYAALLRESFYTDLVIVGQPDAGDAGARAVPFDLVPTLAIESGCPLLIVPKAGEATPGASKVMLAWKPGRESARAARAALPWLRQASSIVVAIATDPESHLVEDERLAHWLALHGVRAPLNWQAVADEDAGLDLLALADGSGSELVVMGCYGHSRLQEWILGGASRIALRRATVPLLWVH